MLSLTKVLGLIILVEGVALGLKAYDDRGRAKAAKEIQTQREALAISERLSGKIATVEQTMRLGYQAGWSPAQTARAHPEQETVVTLADALTAVPGSRLREAGETGSVLLAGGQRAGLTPAEDFVVVYDPESGGSRVGFVASAAWLPQAQGDRSFSLEQGQLDGADFGSGEAISACSPIPQSTVSACPTTSFPTYTRANLIELLVYALLLLGPALAILGLFRLLEQRRIESQAYEGEATRAGRILKTVLNQAKAGFWSWNPKTGLFSFSEEAGQLLGAAGEMDCTADRFLRYVGEDHRAAMEQSLSTLRERGFLSQVFAGTDKTTWFDMRAKPDEASGALNGSIRDVTDMKIAIARTKQAENRLRGALEGFSGPFALWARRTRLI